MMSHTLSDVISLTFKHPALQPQYTTQRELKHLTGNAHATSHPFH